MEKLNLYIFDIDGTLVDVFYSCHKPAYEAAGRSFHPDAVLRGGTNRGGTAQSTAFSMLEGLLSQDEIYSIEKKLITRIEENLSERLSDPKNLNLLPGVRALLEMLYSCENNLVGVASGNTVEMSNMLLSAHGIRRYFSLGSFAQNRTDTRYSIFSRLIGSAELNANRKRCRIDRIFTFGDSKSDIETGKALGATTIGLATGGISTEELKTFGADYVFSDLSDTEEVLRTLFP